MIITERTDDWIYASLSLSAPESEFGRFASAARIWRSKAEAGALPRKRDFLPEDFRGWHGRMIIYDVLREPFDLRFRLFGTNLVDGLNVENTGKRFSEAYGHVPDYEVTLRHFEYLVCNRTIGMSCGSMGWEGLDYCVGHFVDFPVTDDDGVIAFFFTFATLGEQFVADQLRLLRHMNVGPTDNAAALSAETG